MLSPVFLFELLVAQTMTADWDDATAVLLRQRPQREMRSLFCSDNDHKEKCDRCFAQTTTAKRNATAVSLKQRPQREMRPLFCSNDDHKEKCDRCFAKTTSAIWDSPQSNVRINQQQASWATKKRGWIPCTYTRDISTTFFYNRLTYAWRYLATAAKNCGPYLAILAWPTPLMANISSSLVGKALHISRSVWSEKMT